MAGPIPIPIPIPTPTPTTPPAIGVGPLAWAPTPSFPAWFQALVLAALAVALAALCVVPCRQPAVRSWIVRSAWLAAIGLALAALAGHPPPGFPALLDRAARLPLELPVPVPLSELPRLGPTLLAAYLVLVALQLAWLLLGVVLGARLLRQSRPPAKSLDNLFHALVHDVRAQSPHLDSPLPDPAIRVHPRAARPGVLGVLQPRVVVPPSWETRVEDPARRPAIVAALRHEIAHALAADHPFLLVGRLVQIPLFPFPPAHFLLRRERVDREILADLRAARAGDGHHAHARALLELATDQHRPDHDQPEPEPDHNHDPRPGHPHPPIEDLDPDPDLEFDPRSPLATRVHTLVRCPYDLATRLPVAPRAAIAAPLAAVLLIPFAWPAAIAPPAPPEARSAPDTDVRIRFDRLEIPPAPKPVAYRLPVELPDRFSLAFEVFIPAERDWDRLRVLEIPLGRLLPTNTDPQNPNLAPDTDNDTDPRPTTPGWRRVRVEWTPANLVVQRDDEPPRALPNIQPSNTRPDPVFEIPAQTLGRFRNIEITHPRPAATETATAAAPLDINAPAGTRAGSATATTAGSATPKSAAN